MSIYAIEINDGVYGLMEVGYDNEFESYFFSLYDYVENSLLVEISYPDFVLSSVESLILELGKYQVQLDEEMQSQLRRDQER